MGSDLENFSSENSLTRYAGIAQEVAQVVMVIVTVSGFKQLLIDNEQYLVLNRLKLLLVKWGIYLRGIKQHGNITTEIYTNQKSTTAR